MSRAESVVNAHMDLFGIYENALLVYLGPLKGDQEGTKHACHPWHLCSVPQEPAICIMCDIVRSDEHRDTFVSLGLKPEYFGTHSISKGAITHAACAVTVSPLIASVCIRANWKMPDVMNRYIWFESAGDMFVGKSVC